MKIFSAFLCFLVLMSSLFSAEQVGKVVAVEGKVEANQRSLARGAAIFISDVINVAAASKIQIRFTDGGLLNLIEQTQYRIDSYAFNKEGKNEFGAELVKGGFRALSGSIGKENPEGYQIKTPVASIGVRGTIFEANIVRGETFFGVESGSVSVSNRAGQRTLNPGQFVSSTSPTQLGTVTNERPEALRQDLFTPAEGGESLTEAPTEEEGAGGEEEMELHEDEGNPPC